MRRATAAATLILILAALGAGPARSATPAPTATLEATPGPSTTPAPRPTPAPSTTPSRRDATQSPSPSTAPARNTTAARAASPAPGAGTLRLVSQTNWVDPVKANVFDLQVQATSTAPADQVNVVVDVLTRLTTRSELDRSFDPTYQSFFQAGGVVVSPLAALRPDPTGKIDLHVPLAGLHLPRSGVYPVSVELRPKGGGQPLARLLTHLLYNAGAIAGDKLDVAWIVPVHAPPPPGPDPIPAAEDARLTALANALSLHPAVPLTLQPTPATIDALEGSDPAVVNLIGRSLNGREVLGSTWVPTPAASMLSAGLGDTLTLSLTRGTDTLSSRLGTSVLGPTWAFDGPVDPDTLSFVRGAQFDRVILPESDLDPNPFRFTLAQPFEVADNDRTRVRAAVADAGLAAHFGNQPDQVLAAHQLLADLTQIYEDAPGSTRGVVVQTPRGWAPSGEFLNAWMSGLEGSPVLNPVTLGGFFAAVPPAIGAGGQPLVRALVVNADAIRNGSAGLLAADQRATRDQIDALASTLPPDTAVIPRLERALLEVPSADLSPSDRRARLDQIAFAIRAQTRLVSLPAARTITLTERKGRLPITIVSQSDETIRVVLRVESDKLRFPPARTSGTVTFTEELHKGANLLDLLVEARSSGTFPLHITVLSPQGGLVIQQTTFTIQSTALSGVGVILSVGAALFLMVWWGRHAWRSRRHPSRRHARHHGPAGPHAAGAEPHHEDGHPPAESDPDKPDPETGPTGLEPVRPAPAGGGDQ